MLKRDIIELDATEISSLCLFVYLIQEIDVNLNNILRESYATESARVRDSCSDFTISDINLSPGFQ